MKVKNFAAGPSKIPNEILDSEHQGDMTTTTRLPALTLERGFGLSNQAVTMQLKYKR